MSPRAERYSEQATAQFALAHPSKLEPSNLAQFAALVEHGSVSRDFFVDVFFVTLVVFSPACCSCQRCMDINDNRQLEEGERGILLPVASLRVTSLTNVAC